MSDAKGRAETEDAKKQLIARLLDAWISSPYQRLGQLIENSRRDDRLFYIEDIALIEMVERFVQGKRPV